MVHCSSAAIVTLEDKYLVTLEYQGAAQGDQVVGLRMSLDEASTHDRVIAGRAPVIVADLHGEPAIAAAYHKATGQAWSERFGEIRSWTGVPSARAA